MGKSILITGGARSGKSTFAERLTLSLGSSPIYIATAQAHDAEMSTRIDEHKARRGPQWETLECPMDLLNALEKTDAQGPRLVDCLTLWLTNRLLADADWQTEAETLATHIPDLVSPVVFVTNEVGGGIVPENALARAFRDAAGRVNQIIAHTCDEVYLVVSGYPVKVKPNAIIA